MLSIPAPIWNRISRQAQDPGWSQVFAMNAAGQERAMDRLRQLLVARGIGPVVILAYKTFAPLLAEPAAIAHFNMLNPEYRGALPEICSVAEAMIYADGDFRFDEEEAKQLRGLLAEPLPISVYRPRKVPDAVLSAWGQEAQAIAIEPADLGVALAAHLAEPLIDALVDSSTNADFQSRYRKLRSQVERNPPLMLAIEQSCQRGAFASVVWREKRLATAPAAIRSAFHKFMNEYAPDVAAMAGHVYYWAVRAERVRRTGSPNWSPGSEIRVPLKRILPMQKVAAVHFLSKAEPSSSLGNISLEPSSFPTMIPRPPSFESWLFQIKATPVMKAPTSLPALPAAVRLDSSPTPLVTEKPHTAAARPLAFGHAVSSPGVTPSNRTGTKLGNLPRVADKEQQIQKSRKRGFAKPPAWVWWWSGIAAVIALLAIDATQEWTPTDAEIDRRIARLQSGRAQYQRDTLSIWMSCVEIEPISREGAAACREMAAKSSEQDGEFMRSIQRSIDKLEAKRP